MTSTKLFNTYLSTFSFSCFLLIFIALSGCSPHPGAGNWKADDKNSLNISRINVSYEGTADFYAHGKEESIRRCFWSAIAEATMKMQCVDSQNIENKINYQFIITRKGHADLLLDEQLIGHFSAQAPVPESTPEKK